MKELLKQKIQHHLPNPPFHDTQWELNNTDLHNLQKQFYLQKYLPHNATTW